MVKVIDHLQTGKRKFIKGGGRKVDIPFEVLDNHKNKKEIRADSFLEKRKDWNIKKEKLIEETKEKVSLNGINAHEIKKIRKRTQKLSAKLNSSISDINYLFRYNQLSSNDRENYIKEIKKICMNLKTI